MSKNQPPKKTVFSHILDNKARIRVTKPRARPSKENPNPDVVVWGREIRPDGSEGPEQPYDEDELF